MYTGRPAAGHSEDREPPCYVISPPPLEQPSEDSLVAKSLNSRGVVQMLYPEEAETDP